MVVEDLLPLVKKLDRAGKIHLMQSLLHELAEEDGIVLLDTEHLIMGNQTYPIRSPTDAHEAANTLLTLLEQDKIKWGAEA
jgi:hypothetical protein